MSQLFKLNVKDISSSVAIAVLVAVLGALQQLLTVHGFDFAAYDWGSVLDIAVKAGIGSVMISLGTDNEGKLLGAVKIK